MKPTLTILFAVLVMTGLASCMGADNRNHNPMAVPNMALEMLEEAGE